VKKRVPAAGRPKMPKGYAISRRRKGLLSWPRAATRLLKSRNYWVVTAQRNGRPHAVPVWGVWVDGAVCFGTDRGSRKAKNLAQNRALVIHLESGDDVLILHGSAEEVKDRGRLGRIDEAYRKKYQMRLDEAPGNLVVYALRPRVALAWRERDFNRRATRWKFA
jgi:hypothetical protein